MLILYLLLLILALGISYKGYVTIHKAKTVRKNDLLQIEDLLKVYIHSGETTQIQLLTWHKGIAIPVGYGANATEKLIIIKGIPPGETVVYYLPNEQNRIIENSAHNKVVLCYTSGELSQDVKAIPIFININEVANYKWKKVATALVQAKAHLERKLKRIQTEYYNSSLEQESILMLTKVNKELEYYKKNYPELLI